MRDLLLNSHTLSGYFSYFFNRKIFETYFLIQTNNLKFILLNFCYRDHTNFVNCVRYAPDGTKFISVSSDKKGLLYDGKTGSKIGELSTEGGHTGSIYAVNWSPDSKQVNIFLLLNDFSSIE